MKDVLNNWLRGKDFKKWFRKDNLIVLILTGVLLVIIALPVGDGRKKESGAEEEREGSSAMDTDESENREESYSDEMYARRLEQRLKELLSGMEGVGQVKVMITLESSPEVVVEKDRSIVRSSTEENDAQGGSRAVSQTQTQETTVFDTDDGVDKPYVVKTLPPKVEGVVVVAQGAGSGTVDRTIVEMVQALFGLEAHKVKVVKMEISR